MGVKRGTRPKARPARTVKRAARRPGARRQPDVGLVERLAKLAVSDVADQFDRRGLVPPVLARDLRPMGARVRFAGTAFGVVGHKLNVSGWQALPTGRDPLYDSLDEKVPAGAVVLFSTGGYDDTAVFGGGTGLSMRQRGVAGVVVDGAVRDVEEIAECGLPLLARAVSAIRFVGRFAVTGVGVPVQMSGLAGPVRVAMGDLVLSDADGVIVIPAALAPEIVEATEKAAAINERVKAEVLRGVPRLEATRRHKKS